MENILHPLLRLISALATLIFLAAVAHAHYEHDARTMLCAGMDQEVWLETSRTRADCISATHAIEVDWSPHWAEGIGQSLHYADITGLRPGLILVCKDGAAVCQRHFYNAEQTIRNWQMPITIWFCVFGDVLETCERSEPQI